MWWFKKKSVENSLISNEIKDIKFNLNSFWSDFQNVFKWIQYLHYKNQQIDAKLEEIEQLKYRIENVQTRIPANIEIKEMIRKAINKDEIMTRIKVLEKSLDIIEKKALVNQRYPEIIELKPNNTHFRTNLQEKILKSVNSNSKSYVYKSILNIINKYGRISGSQLKEMMVDEQKVCSRATYYRILSEVIKNSEVSVITQGKEKILLSNEIKNQY